MVSMAVVLTMMLGMAMIKVVLLTVLVAMAVERMRVTEKNGDGDAYDADQEDGDGHGGGCSDDDDAGGGCNRDTDDDGDRRVHAYGEGGQDGDYDDGRVGNADDEGVGGVLLDACADLFHDRGVDADQVIAAHARLAGHACSDDDHVGTADTSVGLGS